MPLEIHDKYWKFYIKINEAMHPNCLTYSDHMEKEIRELKKKKIESKLIEYRINNDTINLILLLDGVILLEGISANTIIVYEIIYTTDISKSQNNLTSIFKELNHKNIEFTGYICVIKYDKKIKEIKKLEKNMINKPEEKAIFIISPPEIDIIDKNSNSPEIDIIDKSNNYIIKKEPEYNDIVKTCSKYNIIPNKLINFLYNYQQHNKNINIDISDGYIKFNNKKNIIYFDRVEIMSTKSHLNYWCTKKYRYNYRKIKDVKDILFFKNLNLKMKKVSPELFTDMHHAIVDMTEENERRKAGIYYTSKEVAEEVAKKIEKYDPEFIIEPCSGIGELIDPIRDTCNGIINDFDENVYYKLKKKYESYKNWRITCIDIVNNKNLINKNKTRYLLEKWKVPRNKTIFILTNPPYGSKQKNDIDVECAELGNKYGKLDLLQPTTGRIIELIKNIKTDKSIYLAIFLRAGVFQGKKRYIKILNALLTDFEFKEAHIYDGSNFKKISNNIPIAFSIWKYHKNIHTDIESLKFHYKKKTIPVKRCFLLKEGWNCNNKKKKYNELIVQHNDSFNVPIPKIIHRCIEKGGSEIVHENVKIDLNIPNIPSEIIYGLWSICVGYRSIAGCPVYIDNAYTHMPDLNRKEVFEIITYAALVTLMDNLKYIADGRKWYEIGFSDNKELNFGGKIITKTIKYLFKTYGYCKIGKSTISEIFENFRDKPFDNDNRLKYNKLIKEKVQKRLNAIGYWEFIPIPLYLFKNKEKIKVEKIKLLNELFK